MGGLLDTLETTTPPEQANAQHASWEPLARTLVLIASLTIVLLGFLLSGGGLVLALLSAEAERVTLITASIAFLALTGGLGLALAWQARQSLRGQPSQAFQPKRVGLWALLFGLAVVAGQLTLMLEGTRLFVFPFFHISATLLPIVVILSAVGRSLAGAVRWRGVLFQFAGGAFLATLLAMALEAALIVALGIALVGGMALMPGGMELLASLQERLSDPAVLQNPSLLSDLVSSPLLVVAVILVFAGAIPLIEETVKTVGVGLMSYRRPSLRQALIWGLAAGCGFALVEGLFNTAAGLDVWSTVVTTRVGATLLHAFTGALMGVAWHRLRVERRWAPALGLYALSVAIHGLWNGLAVALTALGVRALDTSPGGMLLSGSLPAAIVFMLLIGVACGMAGGLVALTHYVKKNSPEDLTDGAPN
jgi:hypothetical protein